MIKEILLTLFYLFFFNFLIYRFKKFQFRNYKPFVTHLLLNLKFVVGIFIWFIYTFYYKDVQNNDVHKFYNDALILHEAAAERPGVFLDLLLEDKSNKFYKDEYVDYTSRMKNWNRNFDEAPFNENRTIIRLNALLMFFSFKTYFVHILFFCFISLIGWILLTNSVFSFVDSRNSILALPVLFLPSVLFWTSGVMKEPLLVLGLGLTLSGISDFVPIVIERISDLKSVAKVLLGFLVILTTKFFVLACLLPALLAFIMFRKSENYLLTIGKYIVICLLFLLVVLNIHLLIPSIHPVQMLVNKQTHSIKEAEYFNAGSRIEIPELQNNAVSILKTSVVGIWNSISRPYIWEGKNVMMLASAIENVFIVTWLLMCITCTNWRNPKNLNLFLFLVIFSFAYFALIGMCTPVLGNLVRYKTPLLPLFMFAFIIMVNPKVIASSLNFLLRK